jgi:hypothetical protein
MLTSFSTSIRIYSFATRYKVTFNSQFCAFSADTDPTKLRFNIQSNLCLCTTTFGTNKIVTGGRCLEVIEVIKVPNGTSKW